ncbi:MAG: nucleotidyltransferase family protein [Bacteroidales bacterium]
MPEIPIVLLAAGGSSRMGKHKQLLPWGAVTLIEHQIKVLMQTREPVFVVLGCGYDEISPVLEHLKVRTVINQDWEKGMGSSVAAGVREVLSILTGVEGMLMALLDQPLIPVGHYSKLISLFQPGKSLIIDSLSESGWEGVPAIFDKTYFDELLKLQGETGARQIIQKNRQKVVSVKSNEILEDIDTPEKYQLLLKKYLKNRI